MTYLAHLRRRPGRLTTAVTSAALAALTIAGCTSSAGTGHSATPSRSTSASSASSAPSAAHGKGLPALPDATGDQVVLRAVRDGGRHYTFRSRTLSSRKLTLRLACAGAGRAGFSVRLFQGTKSLYAVARQPCDGGEQRIGLTADSSAAVRADVDAPAGTDFGVLITQG